MFKKIIVAAALATAAISANADGVYVDAGTLGAGLGYQHAFSDRITARIGFDYMTFKYDKTHSDIDYSGDLKFETEYLAVDLYPFTSSTFRVTAAVYHNNNKIDLSGRPTQGGSGTVTLNNTDYSVNANSTLKAEGRMDTNDVSPYLGIGWSSHANKSEGFHFKADIGVLFQNPEVKLKASNISDPNGTLAADLAAEQKSLQEDADKLKLYPVIQLGCSYDF